MNANVLDKALTPGADRAAPADVQDDPQLVKRAQDGHLEAYDELIRRYQERIYATIYHMTANHEDANDLAQETFITVSYTHLTLPTILRV